MNEIQPLLFEYLGSMNLGGLAGVQIDPTELTEQDYAEIEQSLRDMFEIVDVDLKFTTGNKTAYLYGMEANIDIAGETSDESANVNFSVGLRDFDEEFSIQEPSEYMTIQELIGGYMDSPPMSAFDQFSFANNSQRSSNVITILNAIGQYQVDNRGALPGIITENDTEICKTGANSCAGLVDLSILTNQGIYLFELPIDPSCPEYCSPNSTGYSIFRDFNGRVTVGAPLAELGETIRVTR